jgi:lipopolysaccharide biosynthesis glycosyltransferase
MACDSQYVFPTAVCLQSIRRHAVVPPASTFIITTGVSPAETSFLERQFPETSIRTLAHGPPPATGTMNAATQHLTSAMLLKCLGPPLLDGSENAILYLDSDTIVLTDLSELAEADLDSSVIAAVEDRYVKSNPIGQPADSYFNSGVLLIDKYRWEQARVSERFVEALSREGHLVNYPDQDLLNFVLSGSIHRLDRKWNWMVGEDVKDFRTADVHSVINHASILHFVGPTKPWVTRLKNEELQEIYDRYVSLVVP